MMIVATKGAKSSTDTPKGFAFVYYRDIIPMVFEPYVNLMLNDFRPINKEECYDEHGESWRVEEWILGDAAESI